MTNKFDVVSLCHGHDCQILTADVCDMKIENASVDISLILISRTFTLKLGRLSTQLKDLTVRISLHSLVKMPLLSFKSLPCQCCSGGSMTLNRKRRKSRRRRRSVGEASLTHDSSGSSGQSSSGEL